MRVPETQGKGYGDKITARLVLLNSFVQYGCKAIPAGGFECQPAGENPSLTQGDEYTGVKQEVGHFAAGAVCPHKGYKLCREAYFGTFPDVDTGWKSGEVVMVEIGGDLVFIDRSQGVKETDVSGNSWVHYGVGLCGGAVLAEKY